jgi:hypothetical protein
MAHIDLLPAFNRSRPARGEPLLNLSQVPDHAAGREGKATRKLSALFHSEDRAVSEWHHFFQLLSANCSRVKNALIWIHRFSLNLDSRSLKTGNFSAEEACLFEERLMAQDRQALSIHSCDFEQGEECSLADMRENGVACPM